MPKKMMESLMKKKGKGMDKDKMEAKKAVIQELRQMAEEMMGGDLMEGMKKVTVASDSKEGLEEGLEKAKEILGEMPENEEENYDEEDEKNKKMRY
jgi:hypothetical protein